MKLVPAVVSRTTTRSVRPAGRVAGALGAAGLLSLGLAVLPAAEAAGPAAPPLLLLNVGTGKCLTPAGGSSGLNVTVVQFTCDTDASRRYSLVKTGGNFKVKNRSNGLCLSPAGGSTGLNAAIVQFTCDTDPSRAWTLISSSGTASYFVRNVHSNLCLAIAGASTANNATAVQFTCDSNPSRRFIFASQPA